MFLIGIVTFLKNCYINSKGFYNIIKIILKEKGKRIHEFYRKY